MKSIFRILGLLSITFLILLSSKARNESAILSRPSCICDIVTATEVIRDPGFNRLEIFDNTNFEPDSLYSLSAEQNKTLWYRDIQNPDTTKFTKYWNDYVPTNYHADHIEFQEYFENKEDIELAFQFGPNMDLWAYHIFVLRKLDCCYLITRSYFRHARFTYKAYGIIHAAKVDRLYEIINSINPSKTDTTKSWNYSGYFMDNRLDRKFFIDFVKGIDSLSGEPTNEINELYEYIDNGINWTVTYEN